MASSEESVVPLIGRILMSIVFIVSGLFKFINFTETVEFVTAKHIPLPGVALACAALLEMLGGLSILAGFRTRIAAWLLALYLIPATVMFHNFWRMSGMEQQDNIAHFLKNLAIMGGLLILAANGPGGLSVEAARAKKA
jgi:putative oxidoreductase